MIDRIIAFSIGHRTLVIAASLALAVAGLLAAWSMPMDAIPDLSEEQVVVFADWPGHAPREVEAQVTYPLALALQGMRGARAVRTSSDFNYAMLHVILEEGTTTAAARRAAAERIAGVALPAGVTPRLGPDAAATGQIYWYTVEGKNLNLGRLRAIQDWVVKPALAAVPGVAEVASVGGYPIEFAVSIDPSRMRARGVTPAQIVAAVSHSNATVGGGVIQKGNAEYLVRALGALGSTGGETDEAIVRDLESVLVVPSVRVEDVASVSVAPGPRRGVLEKDGGEAVGGVVLMTTGENPRNVTKRIKVAILNLSRGLPPGVSIVPFYDRTPLIDGAISTVTWTVFEAILTASACVLVILLHIRTSFIIAVTLPLAVLGSFALMALLRVLGLADVQTNIMSLAGIAISIGILVDSSIVMAENAMHRLRDHFGDEPARGDLRAIVLPACRAVGRPIFFSVVIMILSFLPVFALGGMEGKMFRPLAMTKTFALVTVACLAITLVPALCTIFIRGRLRREEDSPIVRGVIEVYRPTLSYLLDHPATIAWVMAATLILGFAPIGSRPVLLVALFAGLIGVGLTARRTSSRIVAMVTLTIIALSVERWVTPLGREFLTPLDEGMVMDMPITVPRASITQSADDLLARDMVLCRFPEVDMVVGKAGRAETPTDPAPMDMIETMVNFRPRAFWPKRALRSHDAAAMAGRVLDALVASKMIGPVPDRSRIIDSCLMDVMPLFDAQMREYGYQRNAEFLRAEAVEFRHAGHDAPTARQAALWRGHVRALDTESIGRGADVFARLALEDLAVRSGTADPQLAATLAQIRTLRDRPPSRHHGSEMQHAPGVVGPKVEPLPRLETLQFGLATTFAKSLVLWKKDRAELSGFGSEMDRAVNMPGWSNIWTMPIQNRVDMLATGVNTSVGVRVMGRDLDNIILASDRIAAALKNVSGAVDVVADPIRGKGYLDVRPDRPRAAALDVSAGDLAATVETALGGVVATTVAQGGERHPVRVRFARAFREDEESVRDLPIPKLGRAADGQARYVRLAEVAEVAITEGPATIKGEGGMLRNYVRMNVRGRSSSEFVDDARRVVAKLPLPDGISVEWTGQFEHEARARRTLLMMMPLVVALIFGVLYWTYRDLADAVLMLLAVPGAMAGGVLFQWLLGYPFTVTAWVGYIACFGMATSTGIIMLVYLREAVERAGGLATLDEEGLRRAVLNGAVHRLRPKLLTEGTTILGLAPMLWADGPGAEVIRPMAAPVLGGLLVADEVIDLFLPVLFYHVRKWRMRRMSGGGDVDL